MPSIAATSLLIVLCGLARGAAAQTQVSVIPAETPPPPVTVLGGEQARLSVLLDGIESCEQLVARLYQTSTMLLAPLSEWTPFQCHVAVSASGSRAIRADIEVSVPQVAAEIDLELRVAECKKPGDDCTHIGTVSISALPSDFLDPLNRWASTHVLQVHDPFGTLNGFLDTHEIEYSSAGAILPTDTEVVSLVVEDENFDELVLADFQRAGAVVFFREKPGPIPLVLQKDTVDGRLVDVHLLVVSRLASDPAAVKLFLDIFRMTQAQGLSP